MITLRDILSTALREWGFNGGWGPYHDIVDPAYDDYRDKLQDADCTTTDIKVTVITPSNNRYSSKFKVWIDGSKFGVYGRNFIDIEWDAHNPDSMNEFEKLMRQILTTNEYKLDGQHIPDY